MNDEIANAIVRMVSFVALQVRFDDIHSEETMGGVNRKSAEDQHGDYVSHLDARDANRLKRIPNDHQTFERQSDQQPGRDVGEEVLKVKRQTTKERRVNVRMIIKRYFQQKRETAGVQNADINHR